MSVLNASFLCSGQESIHRERSCVICCFVRDLCVTMLERIEEYEDRILARTPTIFRPRPVKFDGMLRTLQRSSHGNTHFINFLLAATAENTSYFSAASANCATSLKGNTSRSGRCAWCMKRSKSLNTSPFSSSLTSSISPCPISKDMSEPAELVCGGKPLLNCPKLALCVEMAAPSDETRMMSTGKLHPDTEDKIILDLALKKSPCRGLLVMTWAWLRLNDSRRVVLPFGTGIHVTYSSLCVAY